MLSALKNFVADCGAPSNVSTHQLVTADSHQFPASAVLIRVLYHSSVLHMLDAHVADTWANVIVLFANVLYRVF